MKARAYVLLLLTSALVGFNVSWLDNEGRAACDSKCRQRNLHFDCTNQCIEFIPSSCVFCAANFRLCLPQGGDSPNNTCTSTEDSVMINYYESCTVDCTCGGVLSVEAHEARSPTGGITGLRYTCQ
jgi:hypothetical protein